jgi:hypothetical protein
MRKMANTGPGTAPNPHVFKGCGGLELNEIMGLWHGFYVYRSLCKSRFVAFPSNFDGVLCRLKHSFQFRRNIKCI